MPRKNLYPELAGKLESKICSMNEGDMLPSEQELADEQQVSKPTLRRALQQLLENGKIRKVNGVGVFVVKNEKAISREIVFICHDIAFFADTLASFGESVAKASCFSSIVPLSGDANTQDRILASVAARKPTGVAIYGDPANNKLPGFRQFETLGIPSVYLIRLPEGVDGDLAGVGNADGVSEMVERFYAEGCRKIALYCDANVNPGAAVEREQGYLAGMKKCRLKPQPELLCGIAASQEERAAFKKRALDPKRRPDAICCLNDQCAGKLMKSLAADGVDIAAIRFSGFDRSPLCEFLPRPILTVEPPMKELGSAAAELLIRRIENPSFAFQKRKLAAKVLSVP